jgi:beta-glucosidase
MNLEIARRSLVLLRNDGLLPLEGGLEPGGHGRALTRGPARRIAVIGPNADDQHAQLEDWAGASGRCPGCMRDTRATWTETVLDGIRSLVPLDWEVTHSRGGRHRLAGPGPGGPAGS